MSKMKVIVTTQDSSARLCIIACFSMISLALAHVMPTAEEGKIMLILIIFCLLNINFALVFFHDSEISLKARREK
jgi:hypothetical protein